MRRISLVLIVSVLILSVLTGCMTTKENEKGSITVTATGVVSASPDTASFSITAESLSDTTEDARNTTAKMVNDAVLILKDEFGITDDEITTDYMNISPYYEWIDSKRTLTGQKAAQSLTITIRSSLDKAGLVYDRLSVLDGISISSITYSKSDRGEDERKARETAASLARAKAEDYLCGLGLSVGRVISISEGGSGYSGYSLSNSKVMAAEASVYDSYSATTYYSGDLTVSSTVTVVFEIE